MQGHRRKTQGGEETESRGKGRARARPLTLFGGFQRKDKAGRANSLRLTSSSHFSRLLAIGVVPGCPVLVPECSGQKYITSWGRGLALDWLVCISKACFGPGPLALGRALSSQPERFLRCQNLIIYRKL